jgi:hypothetical protein
MNITSAAAARTHAVSPLSTPIAFLLVVADWGNLSAGGSGRRQPQVTNALTPTAAP